MYKCILFLGLGGAGQRHLRILRERLPNARMIGVRKTGKTPLLNSDFTVKNGASQNYEEWNLIGLMEDLYLSSFGEDGMGELYIVNHNGSIFKLVGIE